MAAVGSSSSQKASSSGTKIYDSPYRVFLSFRGPDTRNTFADHLYTALVGAGIRTFRDGDEIGKGKRIDSEIKNAIETSQSAVIVFSEDFASSRWCLEEVAMIMNRANTYGQNYFVLPVFYHVKSAHVKYQTGSFEKSFAVHDEAYRKGHRGSEEEWTKTDSRWRNALLDAAALYGMILKTDGSEAMFIEEIVAEIQSKVKSRTLSMPEHLTGIDEKVGEINQWLHDGSENVSYMAICGISGIGKTVVARHAFNLNCKKFNGSCFLSFDVRERFEKSLGLIDLQRQLFEDISSRRNSNINSRDDGISKIKDVVWDKKVLLVLDAVEDDEQLKRLLGDKLDYFSPGSKIMVTTKNRNLLQAYAPKIHDVKPMNDSDSIQLFSRYAFGSDKPDQRFVDNSNKMIQQCQGLPLALRIIGSSLYEKEEGYWNDTLGKLQEFPDAEIVQKLRVSYDAMEDESDRELFLEISCFFVGYKKWFVITILGSLFHATVGLEKLKNRCLLEFDERGRIVMHQMVRDMGREICRKENPNKPGERRRLWRHHDSISVLEEKTGTINIEALVLDGGEQNYQVDNANIEEVRQKHPLLYLIEFCCRPEKKVKYLETVAFKEMKKLRMLHINFLGGLNLKGSYENFPNKIKWLHLIGWPLKCVPDDFPAKECIAIEIRFSGLTRLGLARTQVFTHLKILNLSHNKGLTTTPQFSKFPILEILDLSECINLKEVDESIGKLKKSLKSLDLENCTSLRKLPSTIVMLSVLKELDIDGCAKLEQFPENMYQMEALTSFSASRIIIHQEAEIPVFPILLLGSLPRNLIKLGLSSCELSESSFPSNFNNLPFLEELYLGENPIRFLPECIKGLAHLKVISFYKCERLESLVGLPEVSTLSVNYCVSLKEVTYQDGAGVKTDVKTLGCGELILLQHKYKAITIEEHLLDTFSSEAMESTNILFYINHTSFATREGPIQGVEEADGILSFGFPGSHVPWKPRTFERILRIAFPGNHDPSSYYWTSITLERNISDQGKYYGLPVVVPPCHPHSASSNTVYKLTLIFVYSLTQGMRRRIIDRPNFVYAISVFIKNTSKDLFLIFDPSWNGYNYAEESDGELDTTWVVGNWILGADMLQPGDELHVWFEGKLVKDSHVNVKKIFCGIKAVDTSHQVTRYYHFAQVGDLRHFYYGNPDIRKWN